MTSVLQCPSCGDQFRPGVAECPACRVDLRPAAQLDDELPTPAEGTRPDGDDALAVLDLHPLSDEQRRLVDQLLSSRRVRHGWQGGNLVVAGRLASEAELAVEQALAATRPLLDAGAPATVYEVAAWPPAVHAKLAASLEREGIGYEWDANGDLVVAEADEEAVEALFDEIDESELEPGPDPLPILESLHAQLIRLSREPLDERARTGLARSASELTVAAVPFGFEPRVWHSLVAAVTDFSEQLGSMDGSDVRERAAALREDVGAWL